MLRYRTPLDVIRKQSHKKRKFRIIMKKYYKLAFLFIAAAICIALNSKVFVSKVTQTTDILLPNWKLSSLEVSDSVFESLQPEGVERIKCHQIRLDPYDQSILPYIEDDIDVDCEREFPMIFTADETSTLVQGINPQNHGLDNCCYRKLVRYRGSDNSVGLSKLCRPIIQNLTKIPPTNEFISIRCRNIKTGKAGALDMLGFVPMKPEVKLRISVQNKKLKLNQQKHKLFRNKKYNVIILGLDSISHMNFLRIMPKTHAFLKRNLSAIEMNGYTKVGANTFPNAVALLTGMNESELIKSCWPKKRSFFDSCPFIWKKFADQGYATSFAEDAPSMSIFNFQKPGFNNSPVDYYLRPLTFLQEKLIGNQKAINSNVCYGPRTGFQVLLKHLHQMAFTMSSTKNHYFQFIWATSLFHDYLNLGKHGDTILKESLHQLQNSGYFDNTVFVLMSDHGMRWGPIRSTSQGKIEERMPFMFVVLPKSFKDSFPQAVANIKENANRLTTPFDLHESLEHLLNQEEITDSNLKKLQLKTGTRGTSLFFPIDEARKCNDAGIPSHFCVCDGDRTKLSVSTDHPSVQLGAKFVIDKINGLLSKFHQCAVLKLDQVLTSEIITSSKPGSGELYLAFRTLPSNATFEATVSANIQGLWSVKDVTRTNFYGSQSVCVSDYDLKRFCFCY